MGTSMEAKKGPEEVEKVSEEGIVMKMEEFLD
jgi:hypothetical protein